MPAARVHSRMCSGSPGASSSAPERLTLTIMSGASSPARSPGRSAHARASSLRPSGTIMPLCSASGMKTSGATRAALAVRPARERLDAAQPAVAHVHHRLVVQLDLVAVDRAPEVGGEREALDGAGQHRRLERAVAGLAASLRRAHGEVGRAHELVGVGQVAARDGDADAGAQLEAAPAEVDRAREREQDPLGDARRAVRLGEVLDQHGELVAAEPRDGVGGAQHAPQAPAHLEQHLVAAAVAEGVVERLEVVEVDEQDGDRARDRGARARARCGRTAARGWPSR